jgi:hypothetical protein
MSNFQTRNTAAHLFLRRLREQMIKNEEFNGNSFSSLESVNIGEFFCSFLSYGKKKYRVFFSLKGIESDLNKVDLGKVKIYNEKWNFYEPESFVQRFTQMQEPLDKFRYKICCDTEFNNRYDALVNAKQVCFDALSIISLIYFSDREKKIRPYFETYYGITEIPQKESHMSQDFLQLTKLENKQLDSLQYLRRKSINNTFLQRSLTWFREGHYAITEYSAFLFYWLGLETIVGSITWNSDKSYLISLIVCLNALANQMPQFFNKFIQQIGLNEQFREDMNARPIIEKIFEFDANSVKTELSKLLEENKELEYIFQKQFTTLYIYRKRNSLVHEGESFSFENVGLSKVLRKYFVEMIQLFSQD